MNGCLRVKEAAALLAVSEQTIHRLIKQGTLKVVKIGKRGIRITRESVEAFTGVTKEREDMNNGKGTN